MKRIILAALLCALWARAANAAFLCANSNGEQVSWTVGQPRPSIDLADISRFRCAANFNELDYIRLRFVGIPMKLTASQGTIVWRGADAAFIIDNL